MSSKTETERDKLNTRMEKQWRAGQGAHSKAPTELGEVRLTSAWALQICSKLAFSRRTKYSTIFIPTCKWASTEENYVRFISKFTNRGGGGSYMRYTSQLFSKGKWEKLTCGSQSRLWSHVIRRRIHFRPALWWFSNSPLSSKSQKTPHCWFRSRQRGREDLRTVHHSPDPEEPFKRAQSRGQRRRPTATILRTRMNSIELGSIWKEKNNITSKWFSQISEFSEIF